MADWIHDLYRLPENERIKIIGTAAEGGAVVGFYVEDDEKATRYVNKLTARFRVKQLERLPGPGTTVFVKIGPSRVH